MGINFLKHDPSWVRAGLDIGLEPRHPASCILYIYIHLFLSDLYIFICKHLFVKATVAQRLNAVHFVYKASVWVGFGMKRYLFGVGSRPLLSLHYFCSPRNIHSMNSY